MRILTKDERNLLAKIVIQARDSAEVGAKKALHTLGVDESDAPSHLTTEQRALRRALRAQARQLGDGEDLKKPGTYLISHLIEKIAYDQWHRMLFARFLAENNFLISPKHQVAVTLDECNDLAPELGLRDGWQVAAHFAAEMLPQIFRADDPAGQIIFAPEDRMLLQQYVTGLPSEIFLSTDAIGWVYQFWQTKRKNEINNSEKKIGADEIAPVTQLFTEEYMVLFLLHNTLGAWWAGKNLVMLKELSSEEDCRKALALNGIEWTYLRFIKDEKTGQWIPAAGTFDNWPENLSELKTLDPCCGSGHFLVAAFLMLVPIRIKQEGLSASEAVDRVLSENIHGLEIDSRCVELAAFNLAIAAWRYPGAGGYRPLPEMNIACSGLAINAKDEEWLALGGDDKNLCIVLNELYKQFKDAPILGSLINLETGINKGTLFKYTWEEVGPLLSKVLSGEKDDEKTEMGVVAQGISKAANILSDKYDLLFTNVPYLKRGKQANSLQDFGDRFYTRSKDDLATIFWERCQDLCKVGGISCIVMPHYWMFHGRSIRLREYILKNYRIVNIAILGPGAFETISGEVVNVGLFIIKKEKPKDESCFMGLDVTKNTGHNEKAKALQQNPMININQKNQFNNPDKRVVIGNLIQGELLSKYTETAGGMQSFDKPRFIISFVELPSSINKNIDWLYLQSTINKTILYGGRENIFLWENGKGQLFYYMEALAKQGYNSGVWRAGVQVWGKKGVLFKLMGERLEATIYTGQAFENTTGVLIPKNESNLSVIWCFCSSDIYSIAVRQIDKKLAVTNGNLSKVCFDINHWRKVATDKYPNGLPKPYSNDPAQWIFHGHPCGSVIWDDNKKWTSYGQLRSDETVLQVAVARLLGYTWPAEADIKMELANEARSWISRCKEFEQYVDDDGIVCIPALIGESPAAERLRALLSIAYEKEWNSQILAVLLTHVGYEGKDLNDWLLHGFFEQHCQLFHQRPFIWHIWDGRKDGFSVLVNYHKLDKSTLEKLTYTYLGDWIARQKAAVDAGMEGSDARLLAAQELKGKLEKIIEGEPPYDIFIRWKPLEKQPIGWEPDLNDGVRINIRPFVLAGVLRKNPKINWNKDRGKDVQSAPWFHLFKGDRINDNHLTLDEKRKARERS